MRDVVAADGPLLDQILDASYEIWNDGLSRHAYARHFEAQRRTAWGRAHLRRFALVERGVCLASATRYDFTAVLDGRPLPAIGVGSVFTPPECRGRGYARELIEELLAATESEGAVLALLFSGIGADYYERLGFQPLARRDVILQVAQKAGAPATGVRAGDERDLAAIAAMGRVRAEASRFRLDRDVDLIQYAIAKKRLLAGLGPPGARELHFFVAEEGAAAAAYVVVTAQAGVWTIEECGDRDPTGARVGAILQVLLARAPSERPPCVRGWLPTGFVPPQITIAASHPGLDAMMIRVLRPDAAPVPPLAGDDVFYWHGDVF
jgi:predicted N-acetyltransferase YhbS